MQKILLNILTYFSFQSRAREFWYVAPEEIANVNFQMAKISPYFRSVIIFPNDSYKNSYYLKSIFKGNNFFSRIQSYIVGPIFLSRVIKDAKGVIYIGARGFLSSKIDSREWEFNFLRNKGIKIVCFFTGSDIRSPLLMRKQYLLSGEANYGNVIPRIYPLFESPEYDAKIQATARVAESFADLIFNADYDQASYFSKPTEDYLYFIDPSLFALELAKFDSIETLKILHAVNTPEIKGTNLIRSTMSQISTEFPGIEYIERIGIPHEQLMLELGTYHIVINELYGFMPGVFALEAMAKGCVVVTRADFQYEKQLGEQSIGAWVIASETNIHLVLRDLIQNKKELRNIATKGYNWANQFANANVTGRIFLNKLGDI